MEQNSIENSSTDVRTYVIEFLQYLREVTGFRFQEFQSEALRTRLRRATRTLYGISQNIFSPRYIIDICMRLYSILNSDNRNFIDFICVEFLNILENVARTLTDIFLASYASHLIENVCGGNSLFESLIVCVYFVLDFICNRLICRGMQSLRLWLPIILNAICANAREVYNYFSNSFFNGYYRRYAMIAAV